MRSKAWFAGILLIGFGCGGGSSDAPTMAKVAGVANLSGKPIPDATVTFYPEKGPPGMGRTDATGAFQIKTNGQLGAVVGKHKVTIGVADTSDEPPPMDGKELKLVKKSIVPKKYASADTTDLLIEVPAEGAEKLVLDLTP